MMRKRILYISLYFFFFTVAGSFAQGVAALPKLERSYLNHFYAEEDSYSKKCFEEIFFDQEGRLYLIPCGVEILVNSIGLFRFDGYSFQPIEIFTPEGDVLELPWIRAIDPAGRILGEDENKISHFTSQ